MSDPTIAHHRLRQQQLAAPRFPTPEEVVAWLGAVQAQDYLGAKWALGLRLPETTDAAIEQAFADGAILRTHVLRPTWHFVAPADIRWMQALTGGRVLAANGYMVRQHGLEEATFQRSNAALAGALTGGNFLTRNELGAALAAAGIHAEGNRLAYLVMRAELDALICSGPRRGKQFTYALLEERVPPAPALTPEEALAELTRRYFTGHGPATLQDFSRWSGLTVADARQGVDLVGDALARRSKATAWLTGGPPLTRPQLPPRPPRCCCRPSMSTRLATKSTRPSWPISTPGWTRWRSTTA